MTLSKRVQVFYHKGSPMYTTINFKTKKALKEAVQKGEKVTVYQPGPFAHNGISDGWHCVEGPHYPKPHRWYAQVRVEGGEVKEVK